MNIWKLKLERAKTSSHSTGKARVSLTWGVWALLTVMILIHFSASIPELSSGIAGICPQANCADNSSRLADMRALGLSPDAITIYQIAFAGIFTLTCLGLSMLLMWHAARDRMAYYTAFTLVTFGGTAFSKIDSLFSSMLWGAVITAIAGLGQILIFCFFYLFPDGHFLPRWTRYLALMVAVLLAGYYVLTYASYYHYSVVGSSFFNDAMPFVLILSIVFFTTAIFAQIYRYRQVSNATQRKQTILVVVALSLTVVVYLLFAGTRPLVISLTKHSLFFDLAGYTLVSTCLTFIPIAIGVAILRERLWNIQLVLNRTLVYGALTTCVIGIYVLIVGTLATLFQASNNVLFSLIAIGCVALLLQPLRSFLQRNVNRLMYGERDNPGAVLLRLGQRLEATLAPETIPHTIVETVAQSLKLPYATLLMKHGDAFNQVATYGSLQPGEREHLLYLPLTSQNEQVGALQLAPRGPNETFSNVDMRLLREFTYQAGLAVQAVRLSADLQHSREQLVLAREEERRRIRRDLHDGLAPTLAALALSASALGELIPSKPAVASQMATELEQKLRETIGDIRRLVYDLRPPTLDQLGLIAAIHEYVHQHSRTRKDNTLQVTVKTPETLPLLPAALEVAAFRIIQEAFMNVLRHAQARHCLIQLLLADGLQIEVIDDGIGIPAEHRSGVGLLSMRERAAELGGSCTIEKKDGVETHICIRLPLPKEI